MALTIKIKTIDRTNKIDWSTFEIRKELTKQASTLSFFLKAHSGKSYVPDLGEEIGVFDNGTKIFGGYIVEAERRISGRVKRYEIICKDYQYALDRKLVSKDYTADFAGDIVKDVVSKFAVGFTTNNVESGTTVSSIRFNYSPVSKAIQDLADRVGFEWYVDENKDIHFFNPELLTAPFELDDTGGNFYWNSIQFNTNINNIKNYVTVRGGVSVSAVKEFTEKADGIQRMWNVGYFFEEFNVYVNDVAKSIGIDGKDTSPPVAVLWNKDNKTIIFREDNKPALNDIVKWTGKTVVPVISQASDGESISKYGRFDFVIVDKSIISFPEARQRAEAEIRKFIADTNELVFRTNQDGLKVGQRIKFNSVYWGIDKWFVIKRTILKSRNPLGTEKDYAITCTGSETIGIIDVLKQLLVDDKIKQIEIAKYEIVDRYMALSDTFKMADVAPVFKDIETGPWYVWDGISPKGRASFCQAS